MTRLSDYLFHEEPGITLYCGDCRKVLPLLEGEVVDLALTDPPYGDTSLDWDIPATGWLPLILPMLVPSGSLWCFGSMRFFLRGGFDGWTMAQDLVWEKHNGSGFHADRFKRVHEHALHFYPEHTPWSAIHHEPVYTQDATARTIRRKQRPPHTGHIEAGHYASEDGGPRLMRSVIYCRSEHGRADHPTQKPTGILRPLISYSSPVGGLVLDPFAGSGSTLIASREIGRNTIGIEIEPKYCETAVKRLRQEVLL